MTPARAAGLALGVVRLVLAAAILAAVAYIFSWRLLWEGPVGSDTPFHLGLEAWVAQSFPAIHWWYRWDGGGIPYGLGYPLAAHWSAVAVSRASGLDLSQGLQVVQFAVNPLGAIGVYTYCAWRFHRPLAGLAAGILYLLSPMTWTFLVDWGFFSNQAGTVLFMPSLIAIDVCHSRWVAGDRGWRFRLAAILGMALTALLGMIAPSIVWGPLLALPAYALAAPQARLGLRWLLTVAPVLAAGALLLSAFWALPLQDYLQLVGSRHPAPTYSPSLQHLWSFQQVFQLSPVRMSGIDSIYTRTSVTPAAWIPALAGVLLAPWEGRVRALLPLVGLGILSMTFEPIYAATFSLPLLPLAVHFRTGMLFLQFGIPILGGLGLFAVLPRLVALTLHRRPASSLVSGAIALVVAAAGLLALSADVALAGGEVLGVPHGVAYGSRGTFDVRDIWSRHPQDACLEEANRGLSTCRDPVLSGAFDIIRLEAACRSDRGEVRTDPAICPALAGWSAADDRLVEASVRWCVGRDDPVCRAHYDGFAEQVLDPAAWRPFRVSCYSRNCDDYRRELARQAGLFPGPPQRAALDAHTPLLLEDFHALVGGGQAYSYNYQLLGSPELDDYLKGTMVERPGTAAKRQLAEIAGIDAVALDPAAAALLAKDYSALGWSGSGTNPVVFIAPAPRSLAEEWPAARTVLVVGASQTDASHPYNDILQRAVEGMIPYSDGWLVRGRSAYVDDYSDRELAHYQALLLQGYRYHDRAAAWSRLESYVRGGGSLYVETGWQYVDPDWNAGAAPALLPVPALNWRALDAEAPVVVNGTLDPGWGDLHYPGGAWSASTAGTVRAGAEAEVVVGGSTVAARWKVGRGRVFWTGMNLLAHTQVTRSADEAAFIADQWRWLLGGAVSAQVRLDPAWSGDDEVRLSLLPAAGPTSVMLKQSSVPGWRAELRWPGGSRPVEVEQAELDYLLVRLDSVPEGATLVYRFGATARVIVWWMVSALTSAALLAWLLLPGAGAAARQRLGTAVAALKRRASVGDWDEQ